MSFFSDARTYIADAFRPKPKAPTAAAGLPPATGDAPLAPWPNFDRYPVVIGSNLTLQYISSVFRLATTGYRREYVDVLDELLERDPATYAVYAQRVFGVAGARWTVEPAECAESEKDEAEEIRAAFEHDFRRIPDLKQSIASLLWAVYYGVSCCEIGWDRDEQGWHPSRLFFVHSRRIQYPDPLSWSAHIWDWGMVRSWDSVGSDPSTARFGIRIDDYPGKFILHAPQLRGDYPTRDGIGRETAYWQAIKGMAARNGSNYIERFANPWAFGSYTTSETGNPRAATDDDITALDRAVNGLGNGLAGATLPDCATIEFKGPGVTSNQRGLAHASWIDLCDKQIAKAVLGQDDTVGGGPNGSRASTEVRKEGTVELYSYDADCVGASLDRDLALAWTRLNRPGREHLSPHIVGVFDKAPDIGEVVDYAVKLAGIGMPIDADAMADRCDVPLIPNEDENGKPRKGPRRLAPLKQIDMFALDSGEPPPPPVIAPPPGVKPGAQTPDPTADAGPKPGDKDTKE